MAHAIGSYINLRLCLLIVDARFHFTLHWRTHTHTKYNTLLCVALPLVTVCACVRCVVFCLLFSIESHRVLISHSHFFFILLHVP